MSDIEPRKNLWQRGMKSPNPNGRPRIEGRIRQLAQKHSRRAISRLVQLMDKSKNERIVLLAANSILDRAVGKPAQAVALSGPDGEPLQLGAPVTSAIEAARIYAQVLGGAIALESVRITPSALESAPVSSSDIEHINAAVAVSVNSLDAAAPLPDVSRDVQPSNLIGLAHDDVSKVVDIWSRLAK